MKLLLKTQAEALEEKSKLVISLTIELNTYLINMYKTWFHVLIVKTFK